VPRETGLVDEGVVLICTDTPTWNDQAEIVISDTVYTNTSSFPGGLYIIDIQIQESPVQAPSLDRSEDFALDDFRGFLNF
jgi:hypothetical protein